MKNLNIETEYFRCNLDVSACTVEAAEKARKFVQRYGSEIIFLHKDGKVTQYNIFSGKEH